ncbi:hypothetical protein V8F06_001854 [Rhypophila decipiens]
MQSATQVTQVGQGPGILPPPISIYLANDSDEECREVLANKESLFQNDGLWPFAPDMVARLPCTKFRITKWTHGYVPRACVRELASRVGSYSAKDLSVFNVAYTDCDTPWVFCNHPQSRMRDSDMAEQFGRLPVKMRSHVRHVMGLPRGLIETCEAYSNFDGDIVFLGVPIHPVTFAAVWVHEVAHSIDSITFWQDEEFSAVEKDSAVPTDYATTNQTENFAENFVLALYVRTGGVIPKDKWNKIKWQQKSIVDKYGDVLDPNGTCSSRKRAICDEIICVYPDSWLHTKGPYSLAQVLAKSDTVGEDHHTQKDLGENGKRTTRPSRILPILKKLSRYSTH